MPEGVEGQQPSQVEKRNIPQWRQEAAQDQKVESHPDEALGLLEKGDVIGYMDVENKRYLQENAQTPEEAEQLLQIYENAKKLQETVTKFSEDDPNIPASEETKKKLDAFTDRSAKYLSLSKKATVGTIITGGAVELVNYFTGMGIPTGYAFLGGISLGGTLGMSLEGYAMKIKGRENLNALVEKNKPTNYGSNATIPSTSRG